MSATHFSGPIILGSGSVETIDGATTLTANDVGKTFFLDAAAGATVTLPPLQAGAVVKFVVASTFATSNWVLASSEGDNINGFVHNIADGAIVAGAEDQINLVATAESVGDYYVFTADTANSQWIVSGQSVTTGATTATDPA
jgi:hypothetical protein